MPDSLLAWLRLSRVPNIGPVLVKRAVELLGSPQAVLAADPGRLADVEGIGTLRAQAFSHAMRVDEAQREIDLVAQHGMELLCPDDPRWPAGLRTIPDPPMILYLRGTLLPEDNLSIGIVGARQCTLYGREQSSRFASQLAQAGFSIISGGARGIDTAAHEGALRVHGRTIVIQGCGNLNIYPPENAALYDRIVAQGGAILSELPLDAPPAKENFPPRNRLIAGMSLGILVIEANLRSGSLITARLAAADYGREVFALPGRVDSPASAGTHHLIKSMTAHLVETADDIVTALGEVGAAVREVQAHSPPPAETAKQQSLFAAPTSAPAPAPQATFTATQQKILAALDSTQISVDELVDRTSLPPAVLMAELTMLQIRGAVARGAANCFTRRA